MLPFSNEDDSMRIDTRLIRVRRHSQRVLIIHGRKFVTDLFLLDFGVIDAHFGVFDKQRAADVDGWRLAGITYKFGAR